ncbi:MAG TPA: hypothetical protein VNQ79_07275 [Blastocatellia bacterium]|nr:hypothetical protein [Blastocatellia bacterium]
MTERENEEFYVGYLPQAPSQLAVFARRVIVVLLLIAALTALVLVFGQHRFPAAVFEFGHEREFEGTVRLEPYPALILSREGAPMRYTLVGTGKHGAEAALAGFDNRQVKLRGTLIYRDNISMIEVAPGSVVAVNNAPATRTITEDLGKQTLSGEIVDSKCWTGVMNPGSTKVHRDCAVRCISGGIPPMLIVHDDAGKTASLLLVSEAGKPVNQEVLDYIAEPVEITGQVVREGTQLFLRADPKTIRRVP